MKSKHFEVRLKETHAISLPHEVVLPFLKKGHKRVKVEAAFEHRMIVFYGALQKRGSGYFLTFGKQNQKTLGVFPSDYFTLQFSEDDSKYGVEMPEELEAVLASDTGAQEIFESFTDGKKRSIIYMIAKYKTVQTRIDKSILLCENIKRGIRNPMDLLRS